MVVAMVVMLVLIAFLFVLNPQRRRSLLFRPWNYIEPYAPQARVSRAFATKEKKNRKKRASRRTFADTAMQISTIEPGDESTAEDF